MPILIVLFLLGGAILLATSRSNAAPAGQPSPPTLPPADTIHVEPGYTLIIMLSYPGAERTTAEQFQAVEQNLISSLERWGVRLSVIPPTQVPQSPPAGVVAMSSRMALFPTGSANSIQACTAPIASTVRPVIPKQIAPDAVVIYAGPKSC